MSLGDQSRPSTKQSAPRESSAADDAAAHSSKDRTSAIKGPLKAEVEPFRVDPHATFAALRPMAGVIEIGDAGACFASRAADVHRLMATAGTRQVETELLTAQGVSSGALWRFYETSMLTSNPPRHLERRGPCMRAFSQSLVESWRPRIRAVAHQLIDEAIAKRESDFVESISAPLPSRMIAEILGLPVEDAPDFSANVQAMSRGLGAFREKDLPVIDAAAERLFDYVRQALTQRRTAPGEDFLSGYLAKVDERGRLDAIEATTQIVTLVIAGSDTTRFALTMTLAQLLARPQEWAALCADAALAPGAVREGLRFEPPVGSMARVFTEPMYADGVAFEPGDLINLSILAAQRDPDLYDAPQRFDIRRRDHQALSLTFGVGAHRCIGAALAMAEMEEALLALAERAPQVRMSGPAPEALGHAGIRGVTAMPVRWR